jgi:hypothetical protein
VQDSPAHEVPFVSIAHYKATAAALTRSRPADDPDLIEARRNLRAAVLAAHVEKSLAGAPALTDSQRRGIARLLIGGAPDAAA